MYLTLSEVSLSSLNRLKTFESFSKSYLNSIGFQSLADSIDLLLQDCRFSHGACLLVSSLKGSLL